MSVYMSRGWLLDTFLSLFLLISLVVRIRGIVFALGRFALVVSRLSLLGLDLLRGRMIGLLAVRGLGLHRRGLAFLGAMLLRRP